jgi:RNase adaptor protein for sRNA GlmZ degradation
VATAAFQAAVPWTQDLHGIALDVRSFTDPGSREHCRHAGLHPQILKGLVEHAEFPRLWVWLAERLCRAWQEGSAGEVVYFACKSGKHRSVGLMWLLRCCLQEDSSFSVGECCHTTALREACACRMCGECDVSRRDAVREQVVAAAWRAWHLARTDPAGPGRIALR